MTWLELAKKLCMLVEFAACVSADSTLNSLWSVDVCAVSVFCHTLDNESALRCQLINANGSVI